MDTASLFVTAGSNSNATIELWSESDAGIVFRLVGYWSNPPRTYTETMVDLGNPSADMTWEKKDLSSHGVPPGAVVQIAMANGSNNAPNLMGLRRAGSSKNRMIPLHKAEAGGYDLGTTHVNADMCWKIDWYGEDVSDDLHFYMLGFWE